MYVVTLYVAIVYVCFHSHIDGNHLLMHLPSLENSRRLKAIDIEQCSLVELPEDLCTTCQQLVVL